MQYLCGFKWCPNNWQQAAVDSSEAEGETLWEKDLLKL
jgi:hypothetical protein